MYRVVLILSLFFAGAPMLPAAAIPQTVQVPQDIYKTFDTDTMNDAILLCRGLPELLQGLGLNKKDGERRPCKNPKLSEAQQLADSIASAFPTECESIELLKAATFLMANTKGKRLMSIALFLNWHALIDPEDDMEKEARLAYVQQRACESEVPALQMYSMLPYMIPVPALTMPYAPHEFSAATSAAMAVLAAQPEQNQKRRKAHAKKMQAQAKD